MGTRGTPDQPAEDPATYSPPMRLTRAHQNLLGRVWVDGGVVWPGGVEARPARSRTRNRKSAARSPRSISRLRIC
jgi:hypothetical protein